jgi:CheY-like chemotaxis protein
VLDIGLPEMDGNELAERLRASDATRGATLIALTGYSQESNRSRAMSAGFDHFLVKPMEIAKLTELLAGVTRSERH